MFKFEEYQKLLSCHNMYNELSDKASVASMEYEEYGDEERLNVYLKTEEEVDKFKFEVYAKAVFEEFNKIKPQLRSVWESNKCFKWEDVIGDSFEACDEDKRRILFGMVEEEDPYILPQEYYLGKTRIEEYMENTYGNAND